MCFAFHIGGVCVCECFSDVKFFRRLNVKDTDGVKFVRIFCVPLTPIAWQTWAMMKKSMLKAQNSRVMCGIAPKSPAEKRILKLLREMGEIQDQAF